MYLLTTRDHCCSCFCCTVWGFQCKQLLKTSLTESYSLRILLCVQIKAAHIEVLLTGNCDPLSSYLQSWPTVKSLCCSVHCCVCLHFTEHYRYNFILHLCAFSTIVAIPCSDWIHIYFYCNERIYFTMHKNRISVVLNIAINCALINI